VQDSPFMQAVTEICRKDPRYHSDAYLFTREALDYAVRLHKKSAAKGTARHVTGKELMEGIRVFALQEFGPMTVSVLESWGITRTADFGSIVFNLVESGKLGKTADDRREDFDDVFDFHETFAKPFLPRAASEEHAPAGRTRRRRSSKAVRGTPEREAREGEHIHG
jgi:uncharacterized repeat protein (TIGR04138 family)